MDKIIDTLAASENSAEHRLLLEHRAAGLPAGLAPRIQSEIVTCLYSDPARAARLVDAGRQLAELTADATAAAYAWRGEAHLAYVRGQHAEAAELYGKAAEAFAGLGLESEEARTRSSGLQTLIYLSRYEQASQWAAQAEAIFLRHNDELRLARLDSNVGNIYFRQDRAREAVTRYERALETFTKLGDDKDIAAALSNLVVSYTSLGQFPEALDYYERVRRYCRERSLAPLSAQADYNIAYLYFQRGDYADARVAYQRSREVCAQVGDAYHAALCDLDESELALELNLLDEGEAMAARAAAGFDSLGMRYEQAKALVNLGVAASHRGDLAGANRLLRNARVIFEAEGNGVWTALIDLLRSILAFRGDRLREAQRLSAAAWAVLSTTMIPSRAAHCQLVLAQLWLREGQADRARAVGREALARSGEHPSPSLVFHAHLLEGQVNEVQGRWPDALAAYEAARTVLEDLRVRLDTEDLRISLLKDKLSVYESLVAMYLDSPIAAADDSASRALLLVQQAKSRSLADRLLHPSGGSPKGFDGAGSARLQALQSDLTWHYRQMELAALLQRAGIANLSLDELSRRAEALERALVEEQSRRHPSTEAGVPRLLAPAHTLEHLQEAVPNGSVLLEFFEARGVLTVFVIRRGMFEAVRLGSCAPVRQALKLLRFQLSRVSPAAGEGPALVPAGLEETHHHLAELYTRLIRPVEHALAGCRHIVIAPHRQLHALPFAALHDGAASLADRFTLSVVPSASVYLACRKRPAEADPSGAAVIAVPDPHAPHIESEARFVAQLLPGARLHLGDDATRDTFFREAASVHTLHLAAHGLFRRDNPMFSSIQLADTRLSLFDLLAARFNVNLLTLSACNSGASVPVGGDEVLGLMRGFLAAGVRRMIVTLWEVDDAATSDFMRTFYGQLGAAVPIELAMQAAMREVRARYQHPYHWAPFVLVGDAP